MTTMADTAHPLQAEPANRAAARPPVLPLLLRTTALAFVAATVAMALVLVLVNKIDWWKGLLAAAVVTIFSAAASVMPLTWGLRRGLYHATAGSFAAMGVRAVVSLGGAMLAVKALGYPAAPTLLLMVVFYFAVLAAESYVIATRMWDMRG